MCAVVVLCGVVRAAESVLPPVQEPLGGTLILHGGETVSQETKALFLNAAGGKDARIVAITDWKDSGDDTLRAYLGVAPEAKVASLQATSREDADAAKFIDALKKATGVWIEGKREHALEVYVGAAVVPGVREVLARGGVVAGVSEGVAVLSRQEKGFGLLENVLVASDREKTSSPDFIEKAMREIRGSARLTMDRDTAVVIKKRWMSVVGSGTARVWYPASEQREAKSIQLRVGDLLTLSRAARARADVRFPPSESPIPEIPPKAMLVIGGSGISDEGTKRFITHCGGVDARIVVIPTALDDALNPASFDVLYEVKILKRIGVKNVTVVHAATRAQAETAAVLDPIKNATGIWFSGGRQWRLVDKYLGTSAEKEIHALLQRGGAIAGGSAGATIQGDFLVRGNPLGNVEMMVEGYERGLGFLKGVAIDQHFTQRNRFRDMTSFKKSVPHYLGIGIDENTALVVTGHVAEIVGEHVVSFYDKPEPIPTGAKDYTVVRAGESYDLKERKKK